MLVEYSNYNADDELLNVKANEEIEKYLMITSIDECNCKDYLDNLPIAKSI